MSSPNWRRVGVIFYTESGKMLKIRLNPDETTGRAEYYYFFDSDIRAYLRGDRESDIQVYEYIGTITRKIAEQSRLNDIEKTS